MENDENHKRFLEAGHESSRTVFRTMWPGRRLGLGSCEAAVTHRYYIQFVFSVLRQRHIQFVFSILRQRHILRHILRQRHILRYHWILAIFRPVSFVPSLEIVRDKFIERYSTFTRLTLQIPSPIWRHLTRSGPDFRTSKTHHITVEHGRISSVIKGSRSLIMDS